MGVVRSLLEKQVLQQQQEWGMGKEQITLCMVIWQRGGFEVTGRARRLSIEEGEQANRNSQWQQG